MKKRRKIPNSGAAVAGFLGGGEWGRAVPGRINNVPIAGPTFARPTESTPRCLEAGVELRAGLV